jgi:hypothetical protein
VMPPQPEPAQAEPVSFPQLLGARLRGGDNKNAS